MYQIYFDGLPLYDPRGDEHGLIVRNPGCHLAVGEAGSVDFTIDSDHPYAESLTKLKGVLELRADGRPIYKGRIISDTKDFNLSRAIATEGLFACLNDSLIAPFNFPDDYLEDAAYQTAAESGNVVRFFLELLLAEHNGQVSESQRIQLGEVTVADPNNYITRASSEYLTTMEALRQKVTDMLGGYLLVDYSGDVTTLHYYEDLPLTNTQVVEFGDNLVDLASILDAAATYTAILPIGAEGLTLESQPDGEISPGYFKDGKIIYSKAAEDSYGGIRIIRKMVWSDVTLESNLQRKALHKLSTEGGMLTQTISVTAADLSGVDGADVSKFVVGRYTELRSTPHGLNIPFPLMELDPDILNPGNTRITLGAVVSSASDIANSNQSAIKDKLDQQQIKLKTQKQDTVNEIVQVTQTQITEALQTAESMIISALEQYVQTSNLEEFKKTIEAQFAVLADEVSLKFTETTEHVNNVNGDLQRTVELLTKHFEFGMDGLTIKAGPNAMNLTLDNDMILFTKNGQQFGWWDGVDFHTGNIVVKVNERAQFGDFAFVPRTNGSLSFLKVGG